MVKIVTVFASANLDQIRLVPAVTAAESLHFWRTAFLQTCAHTEKKKCAAHVNGRSCLCHYALLSGGWVFLESPINSPGFADADVKRGIPLSPILSFGSNQFLALNCLYCAATQSRSQFRFPDHFATLVI